MVIKMKAKTYALIVAALTAVTAVCPVSAAAGMKHYGSVAKVADSALNIDGKKDALYDKGLNIRTEVNNGDISANAWLLWSDGYLYVYADVTDAERDTITTEEKETSPWTADSFEIFVDEDNDGKDYAMQYRVDAEGYGTWKDRNANESYYTPDVLGNDFRFAAVDGDKGYSIEMRVPMNASKGAEVGINFQVNGVQATSYLVEEGWNTPEYGYITLGDLVKTEEKTETQEPAVQTADPAVFLALASMASAGVIIFKKKR